MRRPGTVFVYEIKEGERTVPTPNGQILIVHPERPPKLFDPATKTEREIKPGEHIMLDEAQLKEVARSWDETAKTTPPASA